MTSKKIGFEKGSNGGAGDAGYSYDYGIEEDNDQSIYDDEVLFESEYLAALGLDESSSGDDNDGDLESFESDSEDANAIPAESTEDGFEIDLQSLPFSERLNIRRKTTLSIIRDAVNQNQNAESEQLTKPFGGLMKMNVPLDNKIPALPLLRKGVVYTRGNIGQNLHRPSKSYVTEDPLNKEKVVGEPYNALHDPCAKKYFANPSVRKLLVKQGLLTETGQVVCNLTEFNNFRRYMSKTVYAEDLKEEFKKYDKQREVQFAQGHKLGVPGIARPPESRDLRLEKAKQMVQQKKVASMEKFKESQKVKEERVLRCQRELEQKRFDRHLKAEAKEQIRLKKIAMKKDYELYSRAQKINFIEAKEKAGIMKKNFEAAKKEHDEIQYMQKRIQALEERDSKRQQLERELREELQQNAELRQQQFETHRAKLTYRISQENNELSKPNVRELHKKYMQKWNNYNKKKQSQNPLFGPAASLTRTASSMQKLLLDLKNHLSESEDTYELEFEEY